MIFSSIEIRHIFSLSFLSSTVIIIIIISRSPEKEQLFYLLVAIDRAEDIVIDEFFFIVSDKSQKNVPLSLSTPLFPDPSILQFGFE